MFGGVVGYSRSGFVCTRLPCGFQSVTNIQTRTWDVPFKTDCCFKKKKGNGADWIPGPDMPIKVGMD